MVATSIPVKFENGEALEDELLQAQDGSTLAAKNIALGISAWRPDPRGGLYLGMRLQEAPVCPYCGKPSEHVGGEVIYPHRPDLAEKKFWICRPCNAYVGCHPGTPEPLGTLANAELRKARTALHEVFDGLWKSKQMKRSEAYKWLASELGINVEECHIGSFDIEACTKANEIIGRRFVEALTRKQER